MNGRVAQLLKLHYNTHTRLNRAINPESNHKSKVPDRIWVAYKRLRNLSRRSRYLTEGANDESVSVCMLVVNNVDLVIDYFHANHEFMPPDITLHLVGPASTMPKTKHISCLPKEASSQ